MPNPLLSISLVNTNNKKLLQACLESLYAQEHGMTFETILVDNVSTDGSVEMVRELYPQVQVMVNQNRMGFAANHNQAIKVSKGEYILVFNEDTIVRPGALKSMTDYLAAHEEAGAVGCRLENPDGTLQKSCYKFPSPLHSIFENTMLTAAFPNHPIMGDYRGWAHDTVREVDFVSGAAIMVRHKVIETTGLLDEGFFIYAEESDWCKRMRKDGWKVVFVPSGTIVHYGGQSSVEIKDRQFCEFTRNQVRFIRKHHGLGGELVYRSAMLFGAAARIPLWGLLTLVPGKREKAKRTVHLWYRILRWHLGFGPREGIRELAMKAGTQTPSPSAGQAI